MNDEDPVENQILQNVAMWQSSDNPLAPLTDEQLELIYEVSDLIKSEYYGTSESAETQLNPPENPERLKISTNRDFIKWLKVVEDEIKHENLDTYQNYSETLKAQFENCQSLYQMSNDTLDLLNQLREKYQLVVTKTDSLHNLSDQLMKHQKILKEKKSGLNEKLQYFTSFDSSQDYLERNTHKINSVDYINILERVNQSIDYLNDHMNYKESRIYKIKYENLLNSTLNKVLNYFNNVIVETTKQVVTPESKNNVLPLTSNTGDINVDSFSLYYGKFQSASIKVKLIITHIESFEEKNEAYKSILFDCGKTYISNRFPILSAAVSKALAELKDKYLRDYSVLFRSCSLFIMKVCKDETMCYHYFFAKTSPQLEDYLRSLCQQLYDTLRPCLILINHVEILSELCGILRKEILNDKVTADENLTKYVEVTSQLLQDVEERLVFRTNVFFQHDLSNYHPSPGDLAYPEKLEQLEKIALDLQEVRVESRASVTSLESQEVAAINSTPLAQFRSYTGNSAADLHGMWYPTVKRTLVCLSRLYFCLDREIFQGLAQEGLAICIKTVDHAASLISAKKTQIDGCLFQIKHLLIIREQIAPFQVDFTVKEVSLDFSGVQKAAVDLINRRDMLFSFSSNNALLEFLLEGTPKVREYLIDSRKEIDKQLKHSCEAFIMHCTNMLIGNLTHFMQTVESCVKTIKDSKINIRDQSFGRPEVVAELVTETLKNIKSKIPEIQRSMQLYLSNRETEFILFRPIKNNVINVFIQIEQVFNIAKYTEEDRVLFGCPSGEQVNILICSVSLSTEEQMSS